MATRFRTSVLLLVSGLLVPTASGFVVGCGNRATVEHGYDNSDSPLGEPNESYSSSVEFHGSEAEKQLATAKSLLRDGKYDQALPLLSEVYRDHDAEPELRAEARLRWAEASGSLFNSQRDLDGAIEALSGFADEFPDSKWLREAHESLDRMKSTREKLGRGQG